MHPYSPAVGIPVLASTVLTSSLKHTPSSPLNVGQLGLLRWPFNMRPLDSNFYFNEENADEKADCSERAWDVNLSSERWLVSMLGNRFMLLI